MTILFVGQEDVDFYSGSGGYNYIAANDPLTQRHVLTANEEGVDLHSTQFTNVAEGWIHFINVDVDTPPAGVDIMYASDLDNNDQPIVGLRMAASEFVEFTLGGNTIVGGPSVDFSGTATWDLHYIMSATTGLIELYRDGVSTPVMSYSGDTTVAGSTGFNKVAFKKQGSSAFAYYGLAEVIVGDVNDPTLNYRLVTMEPDAAGTFSGMTGTVTDVNEEQLDINTGLSTTAVNQKHSFTTADIDASLNTLAVKAIVTSAAAVLDPNGPVNDISLGVLSSGSESSSSGGYAKTGGVERVQKIFPTDPNTSSAWTHASANAVEVVVTSS